MKKAIGKRVQAALLTISIMAQTLCMNGVTVSATPAVTETEKELECCYDAGYQMDEWFLFIEGGDWEENLTEDDRVVFYNAETKDSVVYEHDKLVFDSIEGLYYIQDSKTYITDYYRVRKGEQEALLYKDGTTFNENLQWYDAVDVREDCVIVTVDGKQKILYKKDGQIHVLAENLPEDATFTCQDGYYFLEQDENLIIYNETLEKCVDLDGYEAANWGEYSFNADYGYLIVYREIISESGLGGMCVYNVIDMKGNFLFDDIEVSSWGSSVPYFFTGKYIYDDNKSCLYDMDGLQVVLDEAKIRSDLAEYLSAEEGYELDRAFIDTECTPQMFNIELKKKNPESQSGNDSYLYKGFAYIEADEYAVPYEVSYGEGYNCDDYIIKGQKIYNIKTKAETVIPEQYYFSCNAIWGNLAVYCNNRETNEYEKMYMVLPDGSMEEYEMSYSFSGEGNYNLFGLKKAGIWHWYMNSMDNEIMQTEDMPSFGLLRFGSGYFQFAWSNEEISATENEEMVNTEGKEQVKLYDQYGNIILGDSEEYSVIGSPGVAYNIWNIDGLSYGHDEIQNGYLLVADKEQKYGVIAISVKYTLTGEIEVIVESEDAEFVADNMEINEIKEQENMNTMQAAIEKQLNGCSKKSADIRIYDISFFDSDGNIKEPDGNVKVSIGIPNNWDVTKDIRVYHVLEDGTAEDMKAEVTDGKLVFTTDSFKRYAIVLTENESTAPVKDKSFYDVDGTEGITLTDAQLILKYALKILPSDLSYTLADAQMCLKVALKIETLE